MGIIASIEEKIIAVRRVSLLINNYEKLQSSLFIHNPPFFNHLLFIVRMRFFFNDKLHCIY